MRGQCQSNGKVRRADKDKTIAKSAGKTDRVAPCIHSFPFRRVGEGFHTILWLFGFSCRGATKVSEGGIIDPVFASAAAVGMRFWFLGGG